MNISLTGFRFARNVDDITIQLEAINIHMLPPKLVETIANSLRAYGQDNDLNDVEQDILIEKVLDVIQDDSLLRYLRQHAKIIR